MDHDGTGYYAMADKISNIEACPSDVSNGRAKAYPFVVWFNK